jgi:hypothetical protein
MDIFTWERETSMSVDDLASKMGGGGEKRSCSPETALQLQRYEGEVKKFSVQ